MLGANAALINYDFSLMLQSFSYHINPSRPDPGQREKINLNFYFHTFLWCLKIFYEGL